MHILKKMISILVAAGIFFSAGILFASHGPTAIELYENGDQVISLYRGNPADLAEAKQIFEKLIENFPRSPLGYLGMSRYYLIDAYRYDNHYFIAQVKDEALAYSLKALALGPLLPAVHQQHAAIENVFIHYAKQKENIQQYLALFPQTAKTYFLVGEFFCDREDFELALEAYEKALYLDPAKTLEQKILSRIAWVYLMKLGRPTDAITYYQKALESDKKNAVIQEYLGIAYFQVKNYPEAIALLTQSLKVCENPVAKSYLLQAQGLVLESEGDLTKAIGFLKAALDLNYEQRSALYFLGSLFYQLADYTNAYGYFTRVIHLEPRRPEAYYFAGRSAQFLGQKDEALRFYQWYLQLQTEGEAADWIRKNFPELSQK